MAVRLWPGVVAVVLLKYILEVADGSSLPNTELRTCVVGAGYSGLGTARYLKEYGVNFTVFEATTDVGGNWRFDPSVGVDPDGIPVFTSQYKGLRTNTPKQLLEYHDYPFPEATATYPTGTCMHKYLQSFPRKYGFLDNIQFRSLVTLITRVAERWSLTYIVTDTKESRTEFCDTVIIASGRFKAVNWPNITGMEMFEGKMMHSHDYKDPEQYRNHRVLLVGVGPSGVDLSVQLSYVTSKLVHSYHGVYNQPELPTSYIRKPDILTFTPTGAVFMDGSFEDFDEVILATGYNYDYPFLDETSGVTTTGQFVLPLYRHVVNIRNPSMMFVGASDSRLIKVFDVQGHYAAAVAAGKVELPPQEEMLNSWLDQVYESQSKGRNIVDVNYIEDADQYFGDMTQATGGEIPRVPTLLVVMRDFNTIQRAKDFPDFRNYEWTILDDNNFQRKYEPGKDLSCPVDV